MIWVEDRRTISEHGQANKENGVTVRILMQMCEVGTLTLIKFEKVVSSIMGRKILVRDINLIREGLEEIPIGGCLNY
jgi:hypothetical protein